EGNVAMYEQRWTGCTEPSVCREHPKLRRLDRPHPAQQVSRRSEIRRDGGSELTRNNEAKDGCGGVAWQPYVLKKPNTSNKQLHELAREIRGVEKRRLRRLTVTHYKRIFDRWESASQPFLKPGHDYFTEFLAKLDCVTVPKGETLQAAFERAKGR